MLNDLNGLPRDSLRQPPSPPAQPAKPGTFFQYMVNESRSAEPARSPYHLLNRQVQHVPTRAATIYPDMSTHIASQALSWEEGALEIYDDEQPSLIDDLDPVPDFVHHPRLDIWLRPRKTLRFVASHAPGSARFALLVAGLALAGKLLGLELIHGLGILSMLQTLPWFINLALILATGLIFGKAFWKWESLINTTLGRILGGFGGRDLVQQAILWSYVPSLASLLLHGTALTLIGPEYLSESTVHPQWLSLAAVGISLYTFLFGVFLLSEAHRISLIRSLALRISASFIVYGTPVAIALLLMKLV